MEKKKLLLVAISVGVFLVIVIGASILVFSPRNPSPAAAAMAKPVKPIPAGNPEGIDNPNLPASLDAVELVKNSVDIQGLRTPPEGNAQDNVFYIYGENPSDTVTVDRGTSGASNRLIVDVPRPVTAAVPDAPRVAARPAPARQTPAAAAPRAAAPKSAAPAQSKSRENFWVQTGSFSTVARAEGVKDTLASKGITSLIENRDVDGKTFFRVRVGPYTSKNEADYWLALIKSIHGFEESQVWKTPAR
ncbi:SPOR domain-containing protein [Treponema primitia]|uniref:SPOR domain-containing protein n=1 Tax=Treponema primitia TaxID=88058 RepID=UPI000255563E|nr:SPOR domain-containing protein [Treponema primitia]